MNWQKLYNPLIAGLLRSPLHGLLSGSTLLITYTGRRSGQTHTTPVNYVADDGSLLVTTLPGRTWWKNLRGGAPVTLRLRGRDVTATATAVEDAEAVTAGLLAVCKRVPAYRQYLGIDLDEDGLPANPGWLAEAAKGHVVVRITGLQDAA